jgi:hypothetical protein
VLFDGKLLVDHSRDPECDAARALLAKGITGKLVMCDGKTGIPRTIINIEKAAKLRASDESRDGLRFRPANPDNSPPSLEKVAKGPSGYRQTRYGNFGADCQIENTSAASAQDGANKAKAAGVRFGPKPLLTFPEFEKVKALRQTVQPFQRFIRGTQTPGG